MSRTALSVLLLALVTNTLTLTQVCAQQSTGTIIGTVTDKSQATLPGATVKLDPGSISAISDSQGQFTIANVAPGAYTITVGYVGCLPSTTRLSGSGGSVLP